MPNYRNNQLDQLAEMFKALSNSNRLRIFLRLASGCESDAASCTDGEPCACVGELGRDLGIVPSTVSHHIKELHRAGLIRMERRGQNIDCRAEPAAVRALAGFLAGTDRDGVVTGSSPDERGVHPGGETQHE